MATHEREVIRQYLPEKALSVDNSLMAAAMARGGICMFQSVMQRQEVGGAGSGGEHGSSAECDRTGHSVNGSVERYPQKLAGLSKDRSTLTDRLHLMAHKDKDTNPRREGFAPGRSLYRIN